jgi:hypothetical protein
VTRRLPAEDALVSSNRWLFVLQAIVLLTIALILFVVSFQHRAFRERVGSAGSPTTTIHVHG